jgi:hypothetical protein
VTGSVEVVVRQWTGHEAAALRRALRLSVRAFAQRLGISDRTVSNPGLTIRANDLVNFWRHLHPCAVLAARNHPPGGTLLASKAPS